MATSISNTFTNGIVEESKSLASDLNSVTQNFVIYLPLIFIILGFIGFIGNAFTYLQAELRSNTCCIYTFCGSIADVINLFVNLLPNFLGAKYSIYIRWNTSSSLCKFNYFLLGFLPHLPINFLVMAIIDRFACTCGLGSPLRRLNQLKMVPLMITITIITSFLISLRVPFLYELNFTSACQTTNAFTLSILYIIFNGLSQPIVMLIFVLLTYRNVRRSRQRVGGTNEMNTRLARNQFIVMIFVQIIMTALFSLQWIIMFMYITFTANQIRTADQRAIVSFVLTLSNYCYYINYVKSFYISILTSKLFRKTLMKGIINLLPRRMNHRFEMAMTINTVRPEQQFNRIRAPK